MKKNLLPLCTLLFIGFLCFLLGKTTSTIGSLPLTNLPAVPAFLNRLF
ncbi:MAG: hypothetical protein IJV80_04775 [Clostridia bacterium]|nr:hypothetical protein [Clostridia bacterium]